MCFLFLRLTLENKRDRIDLIVRTAFLIHNTKKNKKYMSLYCKAYFFSLRDFKCATNKIQNRRKKKQ